MNKTFKKDPKKDRKKRKKKIITGFEIFCHFTSSYVFKFIGPRRSRNMVNDEMFL